MATGAMVDLKETLFAAQPGLRVMSLRTGRNDVM